MDVKELNEAQKYLDELKRYRNDNDRNTSGLYKRIANSISDIQEYEKIETYADFLFVVSEIDMIYECVKTLICKDYDCGKNWEENDETLYFKFIRNMIAHPDGITKKIFANHPTYGNYVSTKDRRIICRDFHPDTRGTSYYDFPNSKINSMLFQNETNNNCFTLVLDYKFPSFQNVICPYDKLWKVVPHLLKRLRDTYVSLEGTHLNSDTDEFIDNLP